MPASIRPPRRNRPPAVDALVLQPTEVQARLLADTMTRFNAAAEAAAGAVFPRRPEDAKELAGLIEPDVMARFRLPATLRRIAVAEAAEALRSSTGKPRFGRARAVPLGDTVDWPAPDQASLPTVSGRRAVRIERDPSYGWVRSPLEGRPLSLQRRGEQFVLVATD